jgi:ParB family chromosome partitioning protein
MKLGPVVKIPLKELVKSSINPRQFYGPIEEMEDTLTSSGQIEPLIIRKEGEKYGVLCGDRRRQAMAKLGIENADCRIFEGTKAEAFELVGVEDVQKEEFTPSERGNLYLAWGKATGMKQAELAAKIGKSKTHVATYEAIAHELDPEVAEKVRARTLEKEPENRTIGVDKAASLTQLTPSEQKALAKKIMTQGMNNTDVRKKVKDIKNIKTILKGMPESEETKEFKKEYLDKSENFVDLTYKEARRLLGMEDTKETTFDFNKWEPKMRRMLQKDLDKSEGIEVKKINFADDRQLLKRITIEIQVK